MITNYRKTKTSLLFMAFSIILNSGTSLAQNCVSNDCLALGYDKTPAFCNGDIIRCPFDTSKVYCKEIKPVVTIPCSTVGAIYNNDGTCTENIASEKTPLGIVYHQGLILNLYGSSGDDIDWDIAKVNCQNMGTGWRLPTIEELRMFPVRFENLNNKLISLGLGALCSQEYYDCRYWSGTSKYPNHTNFIYVLHIDTGVESNDQHNLPLGGRYKCIKNI